MAIEETVEYKGKSLLILGAGGHGKVVAEIATDLGFVKIDFLQIIRMGIIQLFQMFSGLFLDIQHSLFHQDHIVPRV